MKKLINAVILTFVFLLSVQVVNAQKTRALKFQPVQGISYEKLTKSNRSIDIQGTYKTYNTSFLSFNNDAIDLLGSAEVKYAGITPSVRLYTKRKEGLRGFYAAPYGTLGITQVNANIQEDDFNIETHDIKVNGLVGEVGGKFGWQGLIGPITIGVQTGYGWQVTRFEETGILKSDGTVENVQIVNNQKIATPDLQFSVGFVF